MPTIVVNVIFASMCIIGLISGVVARYRRYKRIGF